MKKFTSTALGGAPVNDDDLLDIFNSEIWAAIQALLSPYDADAEGIVVSGCVTTANGGNFDMTAGIVYLNGEFMRVAAATNQTFTKYIAPSAVVNDSRTFQDLTVNVVAVTKGAGLVGSAPGSGQYLTISSLTDLDDRRWLTGALAARIAAEAVISGGIWQSVPLATTDIKNGGGTNPTSIGTCTVEYRIGEKDIFIFIRLSTVVFASAPSQIRVLMPLAIRAKINAHLGSFIYPVPCVGRPNTFTLGTTPENIAGIGYYDNTNNEMNFSSASLLSNGWQDTTIANFGCQFFVKN